MGPIKQIALGLDSYRRSFGIIREHRLGRYFLLPVLINIALMVLVWYGGSWFGDWLSAKFDTGEGFIGFLGSLMRGAIMVLAYLLFIFVGGQIVIMLMSPVYSIISEKVDKAVSGRAYDSSASQIARDIWRSVVLTVKCTFKELAITCLLMLLNIVPLVGTVLSLVLVFVVNCYYFGYSFMDYTCERARMDADVTSQYIFRYKYLAIAIGAVYALSLYTVLGAFVAAFIGGLSTVAATLSQLKLDGYGNKD